MRARATLIASGGAAAAGGVWSILGLFEFIDRGVSFGIAGLLWVSSLYLLGVSVLISLRAIRKNLSLVRDRTRLLAVNNETIGEIRTELFFGPFAHLPEQVARLDANLSQHQPISAATESRPSPKPLHRDELSPANVFDEVYVINLDRDAHRMNTVARMLLQHGIPHRRFSAVDGESPALDDEWQSYVSAGLQLAAERATGRRLIESRGAWAYLKTMEALLGDAQRRGLRRILVFDDDIALHRDFDSRFRAIWSELPEDWKLVYLGSAQVDPRRKRRYSQHLYHPGGMANGSYAVALDASVFSHALASIRRFDRPFDAGALREIDVANPTKVFAITPPLVIADVSRSRIRAGRDMVAHAEKHGWNLSDYEPFPTSNE